MLLRFQTALIAAFLASFALTSVAHADPVQGRPRVIRGPSTATDNAAIRFDGNDGRYAQDSAVVIDDSGNVTLPALATVDGIDISVALAGGGTAVPNTRTVSTTSPLGGGGALSSNLTLTCTTCVTTARTISTTSPLSGGGDLSANRTLTCSTCATGPGSSTATAVGKFSGTDGLALAASAGVFIDSSDRLGLGTSAPTHTLTYASTSTGTSFYNTSDQTTNYERATCSWSSSVYQCITENGGSGTLRSYKIGNGTYSLTLPASGGTGLTMTGASSNQFVMNAATTSAGVVLQGNITSGTVPAVTLRNGNSLAASSGVVPAVAVTATINSNTTAGYKAFIVNATETAVGSGQKDLVSFETGGLASPTVLARIDDLGHLFLSATNTAAGTTGAQTINKPSGTVNLAAAATAVTVTNSTVTTSSIVLGATRTNDATCRVANVVPAAGSFTVNMVAACTAETSVGFVVVN